MAERVNTSVQAGFDITKLNDSDLLNHLINVKDRLQRNNTDKHTTLRKCYDYYRASQRYLKAKFADPKKKNRFVSPRAYQQVSILKSFMLGNRPRLFPEYEKRNQKTAETGMQFINDVLWEEIRYEQEMDNAEGWRLICGTSIEKVGWVQETKEVDVPASVGDIPIPGMTEKQTVVSKNSPTVQTVVPFRFFPGDPYEQDIRRQAEMVEEFPMGMQEVKRIGRMKGLDGEPIFKNTDKLGEDLLEDEANSEVLSWKDEVKAGDRDERTVGNSHDPLLRLEQYHIKQDGVWWSFVVVPHKLVLQRRKADILPYVVKRFDIDPNAFWGIGVIEMLIPVFDEKNEVRNLWASVLKRHYGLTMAIDEKKLANPEEDMEPKDAWIIRTVGPPQNAVQFAPTPTNTPLMMAFEDRIDREIELEGVSSLLAPGSAEDAPETATGTIQLSGAAGTKFSKPRDRLEDGVVEVVEKIMQLCAMHLVENREFYVKDKAHLAKRWVNFSFFEDEAGDAVFRVKVELGSTMPINEASEQRQWLMLFKMLANDPMTNQVELRKRTLEQFNVRNVEELLNPQPMIPQQAAQQQAAEAFEKGKQERVQEDVNAKLLAEKRKELGGEEAKMEQDAENLKGQLRKAQANERGKQAAGGAGQGS